MCQRMCHWDGPRDNPSAALTGPPLTVELLLDSGESRTLKQGDVLLHRGTMHAWKNHSRTEPCLIAFFVLPAEIPEGVKA